MISPRPSLPLSRPAAAYIIDKALHGQAGVDRPVPRMRWDERGRGGRARGIISTVITHGRQEVRATNSTEGVTPPHMPGPCLHLFTPATERSVVLREPLERTRSAVMPGSSHIDTGP